MSFSSGYVKAKLIALYFLNGFRDDISKESLSGIIGDHGWASYLEILGCLDELEEQRMIAAIPRPFGQSYRITQLGISTLGTFVEELRLSLRREIDDYIEKNREELRKDTQYIGDWEQQLDGSYVVSLKVAEGNRILFGIELHLPDVESARRAVRNFRDNAIDLHSVIIEKLL
ncbi:MAG: DUF4364 family protein [Clostridia bacterium]|nr:DUF4364 family protein [Clostridia bacterium]